MPFPAPHRGRIAISLLIVGAVAGVWPDAPIQASGLVATGTHDIGGPQLTIHSNFLAKSVSAMSVFADVSCVIDQGGRFGVARANKKQAVPVSGWEERRESLSFFDSSPQFRMNPTRTTLPRIQDEVV